MMLHVQFHCHEPDRAIRISKYNQKFKQPNNAKTKRIVLEGWFSKPGWLHYCFKLMLEKLSLQSKIHRRTNDHSTLIPGPWGQPLVYSAQSQLLPNICQHLDYGWLGNINNSLLHFGWTLLWEHEDEYQRWRRYKNHHPRDQVLCKRKRLPSC